MATADELNRGRMNEIDRYVIQSNMEDLCQELKKSDVLITNMFSRHIFNADDIDMIEKQLEKNPRQGIKEALKCLMASGGVNAFDVFIDCLNKSGFAHVAEKLQIDRKERTEAMNVEAKLPDAVTTPPS
ncbi:hypothetical protein SNE40_006647 [Patella caerulea]|uniref:CARD domain-containing protein n=2 Tax=Patella caerulea TaxID=87958 RepID=A0AAN8JWY4_PATCE